MLLWAIGVSTFERRGIDAFLGQGKVDLIATVNRIPLL